MCHYISISNSVLFIPGMYYRARVSVVISLDMYDVRTTPRQPENCAIMMKHNTTDVTEIVPLVEIYLYWCSSQMNEL